MKEIAGHDWQQPTTGQIRQQVKDMKDQILKPIPPEPLLSFEDIENLKRITEFQDRYWQSVEGSMLNAVMDDSIYRELSWSEIKQNALQAALSEYRTPWNLRRYRRSDARLERIMEWIER